MKKIYTLFVISLLFVVNPVFASDNLTDTQNTAVATNLGLFGSHTWDIAVDPTDNNNVYIATYYSPNGFFYSNDGGVTWTGLPKTEDHGAGRAVEVNPDNGHVFTLLSDLLISTDHGATYTIAAEFGSNGGDLLYALNRLFVSSNDTVQVSSDEGETFSTTTICNGENVWSLASSSTAVYALCHNYTTDVSTVYASLDLGDHWTIVDTTGVVAAEKIVVDPITNYLFLLPSSTGGNTYRSINAGATWMALTNAPLTGNMTFNSAGRIYVGWYYSDDHGDTWTQYYTRGDYNHIVLPDPTDDSILYDTTTPGFMKSTDAGATWTAHVDGITAVEVTSIAQANDKAVVWVATQNGLAKTENFTDAEPTWEYPITPTENFVSSGYDSVWVDPSDPNDVVTSTSQDLYYSTDAGTTWTEAEVDLTLTGAVFQIISDAAGTLYAAVGPNTSAGNQTGGVITSLDDGATWTSLGFPDSGAVRSLAVATDGDIFAGAHAAVGGIYQYDGSDWTKLSAPDGYEYRAVITDPEDANTIYALANDWPNDNNMGVYKSIDDGATWEQMNNGMGNIKNDLYEFDTMALQTSTTPHTLYVSALTNGTSDGVIFKSSDGGDNWYQYYVGKSGETFKTLLFDGLVAGNTRGIFNLKSRAHLKLETSKSHVKPGHSVAVTVTLKDVATKKVLNRRRVTIYKKVGTATSWTKLKAHKTNAAGQVTLTLTPNRKTRLYARWQPSSNDSAEYTRATSIVNTIKIID